MNILRLGFSRPWWLTTLLVLGAIALTARLGFWQLDRLAGRREFNAQARAMQSAPAIVLSGEALSGDLAGMEYRAASAAGVYDFGNQIALRNQYWGDPEGTAEYGYHLLTPLVLDTGQAVLVDRGWIPGEFDNPASWRPFDGEASVTVTGILRSSRSAAEMGGQPNPLTAHDRSIAFWNFPDLLQIGNQLPYPLLPVYLQQAPDGEQESLPYKALPVLDLSEGPHLGYAFQWFAFMLLLIFGYPLYLRKQGAAAAESAAK